MNQPSTIPLIPNEYVARTSRNELGGPRTITVRQYSTSLSYQREEIKTNLAKSQLVFGDEFGVVDVYDTDDPDRYIRALCGLVGARNLVLLNQQTNRLDFLRIKNVLLATLMVEFSADPTSGNLELLLYGGKQGYTELWGMLKNNYGVDMEAASPRVFSDLGLRGLCERFFERLYQITIDPWYKEGWGTIKAAYFKSSRGQFIDPDVDRMKQVLENKDIRIQSFTSVLDGQMMAPELENAYKIKFHVLKDSGVSLEMPELNLPIGKSDLEYEAVLYDLARQTYRRIMGDEELFETTSKNINPSQLSLFSESSL